LLLGRTTLALLEDDVMTASRARIQDLVLRIQSDYLDDPTLSLTLSAAQKRFGIDPATCAGVLGALVDAGVLTERGGSFRRLFRRPVRHAA
jgi:hypothetical protein